MSCKKDIASGFSSVSEHIDLPPGFRFHPTDEELITHYLSPKVLDSSFCAKAIGQVDLNRVEPWDLPLRAKMGEKEWYFFCVRDRKYPSGLRTNRATDAGYWKATGKDKDIFQAKILVGMKKTLVFYTGRAPRGEKTNWVMHEYRLEGNNSLENPPKSDKNEWVICRIFKKTSGGKKVHLSGLVENRNCDTNSQSSDLPPLMDVLSDDNQTNNTFADESHVPCFSAPLEDKKPQDYTSFVKNSDLFSASLISPKVSAPSSIFFTQTMPYVENLQFSECNSMQDQSILRLLLENNRQSMKQNAKVEFAEDSGLIYDDHEFSVVSAGPVDLDCLWNY